MLDILAYIGVGVFILIVIGLVVWAIIHNIKKYFHEKSILTDLKMKENPTLTRVEAEVLADLDLRIANSVKVRG